MENWESGRATERLAAYPNAASNKHALCGWFSTVRALKFRQIVFIEACARKR